MSRVAWADVIYNLVIAVTDLILIEIARRRAARRELEPAGMITLLIIHGTIAGALALFVPRFFSLRVFGTLRYLGQGIFWHVPAVLGGMALAGASRRSRRALIASGLGLLGLYVWAYHVEPRRLEVTRHEFTDPELAGLRESIVLAQVSDLQTDRIGAYERHVLETLSSLAPDLILYTGDFLHFAPDEDENLARSAATLRSLLSDVKLRPPLGSYAVLGDTDREETWREIFRDEPVTLLADTIVPLELPGVTVNLIGLSPETARGSGGALARTTGARAPGRLDLIIAHSPDHVLSLDLEGESFLSMAGHTHGGQVQLPFIGPLLTLSAIPDEHADAFLPYGEGMLSVSRGIGMERYDAPRLRFLCRPELRLITLRPWPTTSG